MLFGVCVGPSLDEAVKQLLYFDSRVDGVEFRIDLLDEDAKRNLAYLISNCHTKKIFTYRSEDEDEELLSRFRFFLSLKPDYVDLDCRTSSVLKDLIRNQFPKIQLILSYHDFDRTEDIDSIFDQLIQEPAAVYKIATHAQSSLDALRMLRLCLKAKQKSIPFIGICMGDMGYLTRVLAPVVGSYLTYGIHKEDRSAKGQIDVGSMIDEYAFDSLHSDVKVYALIGEKIDMSQSPYVHNSIFRLRQQAAIYVKIPLKKGELCDFFSLFRQLSSFQGLSITMPFKEESLHLVDVVHDDAKQIKAINTVYKSEGVLIGANTDHGGVSFVLNKALEKQGHKILILGSGGTARSAAYACKQIGADVYIYGRNEASCKALCDDLCCHPYLAHMVLQNFSAIINTISHDALIDWSYVAKGQAKAFALDVNYFVPESEFMKTMKLLGCTVCNGREIFLHQALCQQMIWNSCNKDMDHLQTLTKDLFFRDDF